MKVKYDHFCWGVQIREGGSKSARECGFPGVQIQWSKSARIPAVTASIQNLSVTLLACYSEPSETSASTLDQKRSLEALRNS